MRNMKIKISPTVWIMAAALLISGDARSGALLTILLAAALHELGHITSAAIMKLRIKRIKIDIFGAIIETDALSCSYVKESILTLSGPLANIFTALIATAISLPFDTELFTVASIVFAFINLLPARGFDGGRALSCLLLSLLSPAQASRILSVTSFISVFALWSISVYFIMRTGAYLSLFVFSSTLFARLFLGENE